MSISIDITLLDNSTSTRLNNTDPRRFLLSRPFNPQVRLRRMLVPRERSLSHHWPPVKPGART